MRTLFWMLLLANVILFALMQRGGWNWGESEIQAQPYLHAEKIRLVPGAQSAPTRILPAFSAASGAAAVSVVGVTAPVAAAPLPSSNLHLSMNMATTPTTSKPDTPVCLEWGDFSGADLTRAAAALSALQLGDKLSQRQIERDIGYWVYIPPLKNKAVANHKLAELKGLGVREYFLMQSPGRWLNTISLGVFKTREAAQSFLHNLQVQGVRSARVGERASKLKVTVFLLDKVDAVAQVKLIALQKDFAASELSNVPCALTK